LYKDITKDLVMQIIFYFFKIYQVLAMTLYMNLTTELTISSYKGHKDIFICYRLTGSVVVVIRLLVLVILKTKNSRTGN